MSEFDKLIREKIDDKKYEYSAKSWQSFTKKVGWKSGLTTLQSVAIIIASIIVVSCGCLIGYKFLHSENGVPAQSESEIPCQDLVVSDTVGSAEGEVREVEVMEAEKAQEVATKMPKKCEVAKSKVEEDIENKSVNAVTNANSTEPARERRIVKRERVKQIFIIDTDTIPSNDF